MLLCFNVILGISQISKLSTQCAFNGKGGGVVNRKLPFYCLWILLTFHEVYPELVSVRFLHFQSSKNIKVKEHSEYHKA